MADHVEFDPGALERQEIYRLLTGSVVPRPIGWVSTVSPSGVPNLAPFSFFTVVCVVPPMITLTIARNPEGNKKHTLKNAEASGDFCVNVVDVANWEQMVDSANGIPEDESEFEATSLTAIPGIRTGAPRVKEAPIHLECIVDRVLELGPNKHPLLFGEVVCFHVREEVMEGKYIKMEKLDPLGRLNGMFYSTTGKILERTFDDGQPR